MRLCRGIARLLAVIAGIGAGAATLLAAEPILIVRPLHNNAVEIAAPDYGFEVEVSAFEPLIEIAINGEKQPLAAGQDWVVIPLRLQLQEGKNPVVVEARTASASASKTFSLFYDPQHKGLARLDAGRKFSMAAVAGGQYATNPARVKDGKAALRATGMLLPQYKHPLDETTTLQVDGLLYRDKFLDKDFELLEASITEGRVSWVKALNQSDNWSLGAGYGLSANQFDNPIQYKFDQRTDLFLFGGAHLALDESAWYEARGEVRSVDYSTGPKSMIIKVSGRLSRPVGSFKGRFDGAIAHEDADVAPLDSNTIEAAALLTTSLASLIAGTDPQSGSEVGGGLRLRRRAYSLGGNETRWTLLGNFKQPISKTAQFVSELAYENQSSDVEMLRYANISLSGYVVMALF